MSAPSTWGATYWKEFQRCETLHYFQYAKGFELPGQAPEDEAALACGIEFHNWMEHRLLGEGVNAGDLPFVKWKEDPIGAGRWLFDLYQGYYGPIVRREDGRLTEPSQPMDSTESKHCRNLQILGVEATLTIEPPALGLLLPVSAKYDTLVRLLNRDGAPVAAMEHKTADKGYSFQKYQMDTQVGLQCLIWNHLNPQDKMVGVILDEANKSKDPAYRFRRELLTRTDDELYYLTRRLIKWQETKLAQDYEAAELEARGEDPQEAYPQRTTQCFQFGKPCRYLPLCKFGPRAAAMYEVRKELVPDNES